MVRPPGIGFSIASWSAYMTMNGVLNASVSAGSSQRAASVTWSPQRSSPAGPLLAWPRAGSGTETASVHSASTSSIDEAEKRGRA